MAQLLALLFFSIVVPKKRCFGLGSPKFLLVELESGDDKSSENEGWRKPAIPIGAQRQLKGKVDGKAELSDDELWKKECQGDYYRLPHFHFQGLPEPARFREIRQRCDRMRLARDKKDLETMTDEQLYNAKCKDSDYTDGPRAKFTKEKVWLDIRAKCAELQKEKDKDPAVIREKARKKELEEKREREFQEKRARRRKELEEQIITSRKKRKERKRMELEEAKKRAKKRARERERKRNGKGVS